MKKIIILFFSSLTLLALNSCNKNQSNNSTHFDGSRPKLVIGIVVDQMAYDYVERYWNKFSEDGLKKIYTGGFFCKNAFFDHFPTETGPGHACLFTGVEPSVHGVIANNWFDRKSKKDIYCVDDSTVSTVGSFSPEHKMSPRNLLVTTITDRLKITSNFKSQVIGISLKDRASILPAGHLADAAYWYDKNSNRMVTSTYYMKKLPDWVEAFNSEGLPDELLKDDWNTLLPIEMYTESTSDDNKYENTYKGEEKPVFPHKLSELKHNNQTAMQYSPFGDTFTKEFAIQTIKNQNMGKGENTDFLCINFASTDYVGHMYGPYSIEMEDTYLRFDKDMAEFLKFLNEYIGMDNVLIFMTADHGNAPNPLFLKDHGMDAGAYHQEPIADSCNAYLKRAFGLEKGVLKLFNQQAYLDHSAIGSSGKSLNVVEDSVAAYMMRLDGMAIEQTYPVYRLPEMLKTTQYASSFLNGFYPARCGDVFINFKPYWIEEFVKGTEHGTPYSYDSHVPLVFYGWKINPGVSGEKVLMKELVPTIAYILSIDAPEKCSGKVIEDVVENIRN